MRVYWVAVPKSMRARRINSLLRTLPPWLAELPLRKLLLNNCYGLEADALHSGEPASQPASQRAKREAGHSREPAPIEDIDTSRGICVTAGFFEMPSLDGGEIHLLFCKNIVGRPEVRRRRRRRRRRQTPPRARSAAPPLVPQRVCSCHPAAASQHHCVARSVGGALAPSASVCSGWLTDRPARTIYMIQMQVTLAGPAQLETLERQLGPLSRAWPRLRLRVLSEIETREVGVALCLPR
jgi:hypothetical protein